jgi:ferrous iron transport protein B
MKIALLGNPNVGKSSLFNQLTGLNQKVANFAGVTVDKKIGSYKTEEGKTVEVLDLPGTYSLYPKAADECVVLDVLLDPSNPDYPDKVIVLADASNLPRNLLLFGQVHDLGFPTILAVNMLDVAQEKGIHYDWDILRDEISMPIVPINARTGEGIEALKKSIQELKPLTHKLPTFFLNGSTELMEEIRVRHQLRNEYESWLYANQLDKLRFLSAEKFY